MSDVRITDLVDPGAIKQIKDLDAELNVVVETYTKVATEFAKGLTIEVKTAGDIEKLETLLTEKGKEAAEVQKQLADVVQRRGQALANTTNTISRALMEQERVNKSQRDAYTEYGRVKKLLEEYNGSYDDHLKRMVELGNKLKAISKEQKDNEKAFKDGKMSLEDYRAAQLKLTEQQRFLSQEKRTLNQLLTAEEKSMQTADTSYAQLSQQLELLKKAYKDLGAEARAGEMGKEMEQAIQNLDAHLKDVAADMGEFQRNVGNYAIAGQNGVVSTESVTAAMEQQARTTQDLVDQTKILEEAKMMLDKSDANYQSTLDALNAKIEENKKNLIDVSDIMTKDATSIAEAEAQNKRLQEALKHVDLSSDGAQETIAKLNAKIAQNTDLIKANTPALQDNAKAMSEQKKANEDAAGDLLSLVGINDNFGESLKKLSETNAGGVMEGLRTKTKAFGKTLMGILSNPWVLGFLGIAGIVAGVKWWYDYNKGIVEATKATKDLTGLTGDELKGARNEVQALSDAYGKDFRETLEATNALSKQFGISFQEALGLVKDGFVAGADVNEEFLENIKEYPAYFKEAGISASEFIAITTQANQAGIYSDKGIDVIKEGNLRIREMTKATAQALDGIGISSKKVQEELTNGSKTTFDIMQEVSAKLAEFPEASTEVGTALADIFGGPGEDVGLQYILTLKDIDTNLDNVKGRAGELGKLQEEQLKSQIELENVIASVFDTTGGSFESLTTKAKIFVNNGIISIIKGCVEIVNWFINIYNEAIHVRISVATVVAIFKTLWTVAKSLFELLMSGFKGVGGVIEGIMLVFSGELEKGLNKIKSSFKEGFINIGKVALNAGREIGKNFADEFSNVSTRQLKKVSIGLNVRPTSAPQPSDGNGKSKPGYKPKETDEEKKAREKAAKEAEKQAKETLKQLQDIEEAKVSVMADGHEKEMATIRLNFKKKLDAIKGNSANEQQLRINLIIQMNKELSDCDEKYQKQMAKLNLDNRLAAAKEGSKEELTLKLAKLQQERQAEIKEAEKTGADVAFINAKYAKQKEELEQNHAEKQLQIISQKYADQADATDTAMILELNALQSKYSEELAAAKGNAAKQAQLKEQFEKQTADIQEKYAIQTAKNAVSLIEEQLKTENLSAEEREKLERELAKAKALYEKQIADNTIANIERVNKADAEAKQKRMENASQWLQAAADSLNAINDLVSTVYDAKIQKVEEEQEANEEAAEAEQERITRLVETKVITEEEGEARKRAAEEKSAKKNEELEAKKAKLKEKQAKFDKLNSIAQSTIATALALMKLWVEPGFPAAIPMMAVVGALGALQLATIIATPLPKYAKGTDYHKGGPAIVGDGGVPELISYNGMSWITPDIPTIVDIPAGAFVAPDLSRIGLDTLAKAEPIAVPTGGIAPKAYNDSKILERLDSLIYMEKQNEKRRRADARDRQLSDIASKL